jgi:hypothetical protein
MEGFWIQKNSNWKLCIKLVLVLGILVVLPNLETNELFFGFLILKEIRPTLDKTY